LPSRWAALPLLSNGTKFVPVNDSRSAAAELTREVSVTGY
jgi:hypothetical protein